MRPSTHSLTPTKSAIRHEPLGCALRPSEPEPCTLGQGRSLPVHRTAHRNNHPAEHLLHGDVQPIRTAQPGNHRKAGAEELQVDAYYLPDADGTINEVYIYQNGRYIATCKPVARYNENTAEQTEYDKAAYTEQSKYVAQFDKMMKDGKIKRVGILAKEEAKLITEVQAEAVPLPAQAEEEDYSAYMDISAFEHDAVAKI